MEELLVGYGHIAYMDAHCYLMHHHHRFGSLNLLRFLTFHCCNVSKEFPAVAGHGRKSSLFVCLDARAIFFNPVAAMRAMPALHMF